MRKVIYLTTDDIAEAATHWLKYEKVIELGSNPHFGFEELRNGGEVYVVIGGSDG